LLAKSFRPASCSNKASNGRLTCDIEAGLRLAREYSSTKSLHSFLAGPVSACVPHGLQVGLQYIDIYTIDFWTGVEDAAGQVDGLVVD
jgi:hypothetical protein